jgi:hypothetical protein
MRIIVRLKSLWARLEVGEDVQQSFLSHHSGIGPEVIRDVSHIPRHTQHYSHIFCLMVPI